MANKFTTHAFNLFASTSAATLIALGATGCAHGPDKNDPKISGKFGTKQDGVELKKDGTVITNGSNAEGARTRTTAGPGGVTRSVHNSDGSSTTVIATDNNKRVEGQTAGGEVRFGGGVTNGKAAAGAGIGNSGIGVYEGKKGAKCVDVDFLGLKVRKLCTGPK